MSNIPYIWVIEMLVDNVWKPTVGVGLDREQARDTLREWRNEKPHSNYKFRIRKYVEE